MPVATAAKISALRRDFKTGAALADLLGVNRSQVTRWLRGAGIDPLNADKIDLLELYGPARVASTRRKPRARGSSG